MAWPSNSTRTKNWGNEVLTDSDLEGAFDELHTYITDMMNASTGHKHDGTANEGPKIDTAGLAADAADSTIVDLADSYTWTGTHDFSGGTVTGAGIPSQANQAAIEAQTNEDTYIPPDMIKYSPGVAKAWASINGSTNGYITSYNFDTGTAITDNGTGDYTLTIDTDLSSANYIAVGGADFHGTGSAGDVVCPVTKGTGTIRIQVLDMAGTPQDNAIVDIVIYGDI